MLRNGRSTPWVGRTVAEQQRGMPVLVAEWTTGKLALMSANDPLAGITTASLLRKFLPTRVRGDTHGNILVRIA
jgi:hypothetical protein